MAGRITVGSVEMEAPFAAVPAYLLLDDELSPGALKAYAALVWCVWERERRGMPGYEGQRKFAEEFGMSRRSVVRYFDELRERGYIETRPDPDPRQPDDIHLVEFSTIKERHLTDSQGQDR